MIERTRAPVSRASALSAISQRRVAELELDRVVAEEALVLA